MRVRVHTVDLDTRWGGSDRECLRVMCTSGASQAQILLNENTDLVTYATAAEQAAQGLSLGSELPAWRDAPAVAVLSLTATEQEVRIDPPRRRPACGVAFLC